MNNADLMRRLRNDLADIYSDTDMDGIYVCPDEEDTRKVHALIVGPDGTPYEKGFFYFIFDYPENYPLSPPKVKLMTTGNGTVRFNPNLYNCGKVCLSILGTWTGPGWTSVMTTKSVLISIRSLMNEKPFYNEPGYEGKEKAYEAESRAYNERITHDTLKWAVIQMVSNALDGPAGDGNSSTSSSTTGPSTTNGSKAEAKDTDPPSSSSSSSSGPSPSELKTFHPPNRPFSLPFRMPQVLNEMVIKLFHKKYTFYLSLIENNSSNDPSASKCHRDNFFLEKGYKFEYNKLKERLNEVYVRIRMEENLASELYDSLKTNYCPVRTISPEEEDEMTALFNDN